MNTGSLVGRAHNLGLSIGKRTLTNFDDARAAFAKVTPRQARVVELRYFGGLSEEEVAEVMKTSPRTVRRDGQFAKAWLQNELSGVG